MGSDHPKWGGKGTAGPADRHAERAVSAAGRATFLIRAMRKQAETRDRPVCGLEHGLARAVFRETGNRLFAHPRPTTLRWLHLLLSYRSSSRPPRWATPFSMRTPCICRLGTRMSILRVLALIPKKTVSSIDSATDMALDSSVRMAIPGSPPSARARARRRAYSVLATASPEEGARVQGGAGGNRRSPIWRKGPGSWRRRLADGAVKGSRVPTPRESALSWDGSRGERGRDREGASGDGTPDELGDSALCRTSAR